MLSRLSRSHCRFSPLATRMKQGFLRSTATFVIAEYAMDFAAAVASDQEEEFAKNTVGKIARREVCGRYKGVASIEDQKVIVNDGIMYRLTALRFREDGKLAWAAERVFAVEGHGGSWRLRHGIIGLVGLCPTGHTTAFNKIHAAATIR